MEGGKNGGRSGRKDGKGQVSGLVREASPNSIHIGCFLTPYSNLEKKQKTENPDPDDAGFDTHQPSQAPPFSSYRSPPLLLGPGYPRSAPSPIQPGLPLNCSLPLLPSPCQPGNPSCAYSTLSLASASPSGCAHSPLLRKSPVSIFLQLPWPFSLVVLATPTLCTLTPSGPVQDFLCP